MNIGGQIQSLRKAKGMSQEDLASLLSISRQTVSQWETDQTVPSVDNIYRLKEVFGVSFDELLFGKEETQPIPGEYKEEFSVKYSPEDIKKANRLIYSKNIKVFLILLLISLPCCIGFFNEPQDASIAFAFTFVIIFIIRGIIDFVKVKKSEKISISAIAGNIYKYKVFDNFFTVSILKNNEVSSHFVINKGEIDNVWEDKNYVVFIRGGQLFILNKERLPQNTQLREFFCSAKKVNSYKEGTASSLISIVLVILSVLSILFSIGLSAYLTDINNLDMTENMWVFFLFTPLPIASIIFGYSQRRKGMPNKKNIVVGIIMTVLLCIYGSFYFAFAGIYSHDYAMIKGYETQIGINLPESGQVTINDFTKGEQTGDSNLHYYYWSDVKYSGEELKEITESVAEDSRWLKGLPAEIAGCTPRGSLVRGEYVLLYNADLGEFNSLPAESGTYKFILMEFDPEKGMLHITEYEKTLTVGLPGDEGFL